MRLPRTQTIIFREGSYGEWSRRGGRVSESQVKAVALLTRRLLSPSIAVPYAFLFSPSSPSLSPSFSLHFFPLFLPPPFLLYSTFFFTHTHARARASPVTTHICSFNRYDCALYTYLSTVASHGTAPRNRP